MFTHVGQDNYINSNHVFAILRYKGLPPRRMKQMAEKEKKLYYLNGSEPTRALLIFDNGVFMTSCISSKTLTSRMNAIEYEASLRDNRLAAKRGDIEDTEHDEFNLDETYLPEDGDDEEQEDAKEDNESE